MVVYFFTDLGQKWLSEMIRPTAVINAYTSQRSTQRVTVTADLAQEEAFALVQFLRRSRFDIYRECAVDEAEARLMMAAAGHLRKGLATAGFDPR